jgi:ASC-1-like (ASCH) protein
MMHELKTLPQYFENVLIGLKTFEVRDNDRDYKVGDILVLKEWTISGHFYTGRELKVVVTYILDSKVYCADGTVIMAINKIESEEE